MGLEKEKSEDRAMGPESKLEEQTCLSQEGKTTAQLDQECGAAAQKTEL